MEEKGESKAHEQREGEGMDSVNTKKPDASLPKKQVATPVADKFVKSVAAAKSSKNQK